MYETTIIVSKDHKTKAIIIIYIYMFTIENNKKNMTQKKYDAKKNVTKKCHKKIRSDRQTEKKRSNRQTEKNGDNIKKTRRENGQKR